jgi:hypothetical protein
LLSEITILRQDILQLKDEIAAFHAGPRPSADVCDSKLELATAIPDVSDDKLESTNVEVEVPEPTAPILDSETPPEEQTEPVIEPITEQTESTGGFFDKDLSDAPLVLSDTELLDILSSADLLPKDEAPAEVLAEALEDADLTEDTLPEEPQAPKLPPLDEEFAEEPVNETITDLTSEDDLPQEITLPTEAPVEPELPPLNEETSAEVAVEDSSDAPDEAPFGAPPVTQEIAPTLAQDIKSVLAYIDDLLKDLPEEKMIEFAQSDKYETYKKVFHELGLA